jgi:hypothetical protein
MHTTPSRISVGYPLFMNSALSSLLFTKQRLICWILFREFQILCLTLKLEGWCQPAMRPSAFKTYVERLEFVLNVAKTGKNVRPLLFYPRIIISNYDDRLSVKGHRSTLANKEREILLRERERTISSLAIEPERSRDRFNYRDNNHFSCRNKR